MNQNIILCGINARYTHTSIGLRYLYANMKELQESTQILEFVIHENIQDLAEKILFYNPAIVGIGTYIWNAEDVTELIQTLRLVKPDLKIILGGPEASYTPFRVNFDDADYIVQGEGDHTFYELCKDIFDNKAPEGQIIKSDGADLSKTELPYKYYNDNDVANRVIYVEASRGCPFTCEFCLSSIDNKVRSFNLDELLEEFEILWQRGARNFKFIDRTFNLNMRVANRLLDFFLDRQTKEQYFAHFEVVPGHFPDSLKERIRKFPPGSLQLEVGIQTLDPATSDNINRKLNFEKIKKNLHFLTTETNAHLHVDLIIGLPGETVESFANNLNILADITNCEIQLGILKKLSGTTLNRHDLDHGMVYTNKPPYDILKNNLIPFEQMQVMKRFARFWDLTYNSGNFTQTLKYLWPEKDVYNGFYNFADWIYAETASTWKISLVRLFELLFKYLTEVLDLDTTEVANTMVSDIVRAGSKKLPGFLRDYATSIPDLRNTAKDKTLEKHKEKNARNKRQKNHIDA